MKINWQYVARAVAVAFLSTLLWVGGRLINQQDQILAKLTMLELELVKLKASMLNRDAVLEIVKVYLYEKGIK
jgi:hypothetical protein